jgi:hypothetical protein
VLTAQLASLPQEAIATLLENVRESARRNETFAGLSEAINRMSDTLRKMFPLLFKDQQGDRDPDARLLEAVLGIGANRPLEAPRGDQARAQRNPILPPLADG